LGSQSVLATAAAACASSLSCLAAPQTPASYCGVSLVSLYRFICASRSSEAAIAAVIAFWKGEQSCAVADGIWTAISSSAAPAITTFFTSFGFFIYSSWLPSSSQFHWSGPLSRRRGLHVAAPVGEGRAGAGDDLAR